MSKVSIYQGSVPNSSTQLGSTIGSTSAIQAATVANISTTDETLEIWIAQDGGNAADTNKLIVGLNIVAGTSVTLATLINHALPSGAKIFGKASASSALTLTISGLSA